MKFKIGDKIDGACSGKHRIYEIVNIVDKGYSVKISNVSNSDTMFSNTLLFDESVIENRIKQYIEDYSKLGQALK